MKVFNQALLCAHFVAMCVLLLAGCKEKTADISPDKVDFSTQVWVAIDISFESSAEYTNPFDDLLRYYAKQTL